MLANCLVRGPIRSIRTSKSRREKGVVRYVFFFLPPEPKERTTDFFETAEREANGRFGGFFFLFVPSHRAGGNNSRSTFFSFFPFFTGTSLPPSCPSRSGILFGPPFRAISHSFPCPSLGRWIRGKDGTHNNNIHKNKSHKNNRHRVT